YKIFHILIWYWFNFCFFFFFSSRRRHTRFKCDWSSACALRSALVVGQLVQPSDDALLIEIDGDGAAGFGHGQPLGNPVDRDHPRSEERRVGKEFSARWWEYRQDNKHISE